MLTIVVALGIVCYPLPPWTLAGPLVAYALLLWLRPVSFLLMLPCILPAWDLGMWTGWTMVGESDLFVVTTVAVLLMRTPPTTIDVLPPGPARVVLLVFAASWTIATVTGIASPLGAAASDNVFLRPDNALRLAKGFAEALALLPFLRQRERSHADVVLRLGRGMAVGIAAVTIIVLAERALFSGILDFSGEYRVAGPFSSMRVGGGHIGAYIAMALPMALCLRQVRPRWLAMDPRWPAMGLLLATCLMGGYTLTVTFARTGYAAGSIGVAVAGMGWLWTSRRQHRGLIPKIAPIVLVFIVLVIGALTAAATATGMRQRFADSARDFTTRQDNWRAGLAVRDTGALPALFGMGLGTYQRAMLMRSPINRPSDIELRRDGEGAYVRMRVETPFFLGQKVALPATGDLRLTALARSEIDQTTLNVSLCDKVLLYSDHCRGGGLRLDAANVWQAVVVEMSTQGLGGGAALNLLHRPVELSLFGGPAGHQVDIRDIRLTDEAGHEVLKNGDFTYGLDRWILTDDSHVSWRMLNQYLMLWFETGIFGLFAFLALSGLAMAGAVQAAWRGVVAGAAVAGSIAGFLICGLFDNVLEAPRLATLFFLVCFCGLVQWEARRNNPRPAGLSRSAG